MPVSSHNGAIFTYMIKDSCENVNIKTLNKFVFYNKY